MRNWVLAAGFATVLSSGVAQAGEAGDQLAEALYGDSLTALAGASREQCDAGEGDACFAMGLDAIITAYEGFAQGLYRHGATTPNSPAMAMLLGMGLDSPTTPANPDPEPLSYEQFRALLEDFSAKMDLASGYMESAGEGTPFVIHIDPLKVMLDLDGDGEAGEGETLGAILNEAGAFTDIPGPDAAPPGKSKTKGDPTAPSSIVGFDNSDAIWFSGYALVAGTPVELTLSHDFSEFFSVYFHRIFPKAGLPMQDYSSGTGTLIMDADSDAFIADLVAAIHTADFPVTDAARLANVLDRFSQITARSRQNWDMILAETDDDRELVPSPTQTSLVPDQAVTEEIVNAWLATLDTIDEIVAGDLLLPHWRFSNGINLRTFFETATETDIVMLLAGHGAMPYLADGPIADANSFAELNRVMGDQWPMFAIWFN